MFNFDSQKFKDVKFISIANIELDDAIVLTLKKYNYDNFENMILFNRYNTLKSVLSRIESMIEAFNENAELPPVELKYEYTTGSYSIVNGRHRIVVSILKNYKIIPSIIL